MKSDENQSVESHRKQAVRRVQCAVITVSDSRTPASDRSGDLIVELLENTGHGVSRRTIVRDEPDQVIAELRQCVGLANVDAVLLTGGTGVAERDQTSDAVESLLTKRLPGYGELFRMLSYQEIGAAAMLSRATGGLVEKTLVLVMPGSPGAVRLAMEKLILPELGHLISLLER